MIKQFFAVFIAVFVAVGFFSVMLKIRSRKSVCRCGEGHCRTGDVCDRHEEIHGKHD